MDGTTTLGTGKLTAGMATAERRGSSLANDEEHGCRNVPAQQQLNVLPTRVSIGWNVKVQVEAMIARVEVARGQAAAMGAATFGLAPRSRRR